MALPNWEKRYNEIQELKEKNIITARLKDNYIIKSDDTKEYIKNFVEFTKEGTKLSVSDGVIKIGKGVSKVKVSYTAMAHAPSNGACRGFVYLTLNDYQMSQESFYFQNSNHQISASLPPTLINVNEGDIFCLTCYGKSGISIYGASYLWTTITVEVVE